MIFMLVEISLQGNYHTFTAAYTDYLTTPRQINQLRIDGMHHVDLVQYLVISKKVNYL